MNARGEMEVVAALIGLSLGVLTPQMYTVVILVAIVTSVITPGLLSWSLSEVEERPSDAERLERERLLKRLEIKAEGAKLLVLGGGPHAALATHMAAALANHSEASITIFRAYSAGSNGRRNDAFNQEFAKLEEVAKSGGAAHVH